jgi:protoporphyrinogen oxidase
MRTRRKDALAFDLGANFLVAAYSNLRELAQELGVTLHSLSPVRHALLHRGAFHTMNFASLRDLMKMEYLGLWSKLRCAEFVYKLRRRPPDLDFFDLTRFSDELNKEDAYAYACREVGTDFAEYILDAFHTCMMFYRSQETSLLAFLSLFRMKVDGAYDFSVLHAAGEMQEIPNAIAARVPVRTSCPVLSLSRVPKGWRLETPDGVEIYRQVVLASTAGAAMGMLCEPPAPHRAVLESTRYATTVNLAFRVPRGVLGGTHCFYVPFVESTLVAEFTNEALKGPNALHDGWSLVNVGLHESAARALMDGDDETLFETVGRELARLHPGLAQARPYDLQRWTEAMPKFDCAHMACVKSFLAQGQGQDGLYLCGDYLNSPWLEGASRCGRRVAGQVMRALPLPTT